jgi:hypothetical protein
MEQNLTVACRSETVSLRDELVAHTLEVVDLSVDHGVDRIVLVRERLHAPGEIDNGEARVSETDASASIEPLSATIRAAMVQSRHGSSEPFRVDGFTFSPRIHSDDSAHIEPPLFKPRWVA